MVFKIYRYVHYVRLLRDCRLSFTVKRITTQNAVSLSATNGLHQSNGTITMPSTIVLRGVVRPSTTAKEQRRIMIVYLSLSLSHSLSHKAYFNTLARMIGYVKDFLAHIRWFLMDINSWYSNYYESNF
jgi:hypothetical protein